MDPFTEAKQDAVKSTDTQPDAVKNTRLNERKALGALHTVKYMERNQRTVHTPTEESILEMKLF